MDDKTILACAKTAGTRATVMDVLHNHHDVDYKTTIVVGELLSLLESQKLLRRGHIVDFISRTSKQLD